MAEQHKMWGGRFTKEISPILAELNTSIGVDHRLYEQDIQVNQHYAQTLQQGGLLTSNEFQQLNFQLHELKKEWDKGTVQFLQSDEDVHTLNERALKEMVGEVAERLHTGKSRNDQVATDMRMWVMKNGARLLKLVVKLIQTFIQLAEREIDVLMPGYTHLKRAQPVRFSHFILSHAWSFYSDCDLLESILRRTSVLPLGSGALAGNPFPIDREFLAENLGFDSLSLNSMNAVGNRDFVAEFLFWTSMCGVHLSRLAEDLIIFGTDEFGYLELSEEYSTGSSLLPQKRNPDGLELARGAAGKFIGNSTGFLALLKSLPSTYNKDLQFDKEMVFDSYDLMYKVLQVVQGTVETMKINAEKCRAALEPQQLTLRLANHLVKKGMPFRQAHHTVGRALALAEARNIPIDQLSEEDRTSISDLLAGDVSQIWNYEAAVEECNNLGGTSKESVLIQIETLQQWIDNK